MNELPGALRKIRSAWVFTDLDTAVIASTKEEALRLYRRLHLDKLLRASDARSASESAKVTADEQSAVEPADI